jgi:hypothetical protein
MFLECLVAVTHGDRHHTMTALPDHVLHLFFDCIVAKLQSFSLTGDVSSRQFCEKALDFLEEALFERHIEDDSVSAKCARCCLEICNILCKLPNSEGDTRLLDSALTLALTFSKLKYVWPFSEVAKFFALANDVIPLTRLTPPMVLMIGDNLLQNRDCPPTIDQGVVQEVIVEIGRFMVLPLPTTRPELLQERLAVANGCCKALWEILKIFGKGSEDPPILRTLETVLVESIIPQLAISGACFLSKNAARYLNGRSSFRREPSDIGIAVSSFSMLMDLFYNLSEEVFRNRSGGHTRSSLAMIAHGIPGVVYDVVRLFPIPNMPLGIVHQCLKSLDLCGNKLCTTQHHWEQTLRLAEQSSDMVDIFLVGGRYKKPLYQSVVLLCVLNLNRTLGNISFPARIHDVNGILLWLTEHVVRNVKLLPSVPKLEVVSTVFWLLSLVPADEIEHNENFDLILRRFRELYIQPEDLDKYFKTSVSLSASMMSTAPRVETARLLGQLMRHHQYQLIQLMSLTNENKWVPLFDPKTTQWTQHISPEIVAVVCGKANEFAKNMDHAISENGGTEAKSFWTFFLFVESMMRQMDDIPSQDALWVAFSRNGEQLLVKLLSGFQNIKAQGCTIAMTVSHDIFHIICQLMTRIRFQQLSRSRDISKRNLNFAKAVRDKNADLDQSTNDNIPVAEVLIHPSLFRLFLEMLGNVLKPQAFHLQGSPYSLWDSIFNVLNVTLSFGSRDLLMNAENAQALQPGDVGLSFLLSSQCFNCVCQLLVGEASKSLPHLYILQFVNIWLLCQSAASIQNCAQPFKEVLDRTQCLYLGGAPNLGDGNLEHYACHSQRLQIIFLLFQHSLIDDDRLRRGVLRVQELTMSFHQLSTRASNCHGTEQVLSASLFCALSGFYEMIDSTSEILSSSRVDLHRQHWHQVIVKHLMMQDRHPSYDWVKWMYLAIVSKLKCAWVVHSISDEDIYEGFVQIFEAGLQTEAAEAHFFCKNVTTTSSHSHPPRTLLEGCFWLFVVEFAVLRQTQMSHVSALDPLQQTQMFLNGLQQGKGWSLDVGITSAFLAWAARTNTKDHACGQQEGKRKLFQSHFLFPSSAIFEPSISNARMDPPRSDESASTNSSLDKTIFLSLTTKDPFFSLFVGGKQKYG